MRPLVLISALLVLAPAALAQDVPSRLTLADALRIARANNPQFRQVLNDLDVAAAQERQRWGALLPSLSVHTGFGGSLSQLKTGSGDFGQVIGVDSVRQVTSSSASQGISLSLTLFDGGANLRRLREGRAGARAVEAQVDARGMQLRADVATRFYAALQAERAAGVEARLLASAREQLSMTRRRFEIGSARREDVLGAEAQLAAQELQVAQAEGEARKARLQLLREMGVAAAREFELVDEVPPAFDPALLSADSLAAAALASSPRVLERQAGVAAREQGASAARGARWPRITASARASRSLGEPDYGALFAVRDYPNRSFGFDLGISLPIFTGYQNSYNVAQADAALADAKEQHRAERLALEAEVRSAYIDLENAFRSLRLAERSQALSQERLELTEERYRAGAANVSFVELQNAIDGAARAERQALQARYGFAAALVTLEARIGREVRP